jgi:Right handed beta helix region
MRKAHLKQLVGTLGLSTALLLAPGCDPGDGDGTSSVDSSQKSASSSCDQYAKSGVTDVSTAAQLKTALSKAKAGTLIQLANGTYKGNFVASASGSAKLPIALCGSASAVIQSSGGYGVHLQGNYWVLAGFTVTGAEKGIVLDGASNNVLTGLTVTKIEQEGIHFRAASSHNVLKGSHVSYTGQKSPGFGEGVYIGSAESNWSGGPDKSDDNQVLDNSIDHTGAENIDIKEGTTGGLIQGNHFDGTGMSGANYADSWIDVKGNGYTIEDNVGVDSLTDGFQVHVAVKGWGENNVFHKNSAQVKKPYYGVNVAAGATGDVVGCDNTVSGGGTLANVACK